MTLTFLWKSRKPAATVLLHAVAFTGVLLAAYWLRGKSLQADPVLQGYLEVITGLLAFVFAAVTLVRFQGTQDRISLILGVGFMVSGAVLTATSVLFFSASRCSAGISVGAGGVVGKPHGVRAALDRGASGGALLAALASSTPGVDGRAGHGSFCVLFNHCHAAAIAARSFTTPLRAVPQSAATSSRRDFSGQRYLVSPPFDNRCERFRQSHLCHCRAESRSAMRGVAIRTSTGRAFRFGARLDGDELRRGAGRRLAG